MKQKLNIRKKRIAVITGLLLFIAVFFVNMNVFSEEKKEELKNVGTFDSGTVACLGGGKLDCLGFPAQVIIWIH